MIHYVEGVGHSLFYHNALRTNVILLMFTSLVDFAELFTILILSEFLARAGVFIMHVYSHILELAFYIGVEIKALLRE